MRISLFLTVIVLSSCRQDVPELVDETDQILTDKLYNASGGVGPSFYLLPNESDLSSIPQDPNNPLTPEKVALGKFLFHETGLAIEPSLPTGMGKYSCASCHHAQGGFQANLRQGLAEGGIGFGFEGEGRVPDPSYIEDSIDLQHIRTPSIMNTAYQRVMLWNGALGGVGPNANTQASWNIGEPTEHNFLGFEGLETQAIAGLEVHRMHIDSTLMAQLGYTSMFDQAFPNIPFSDRYTFETAGLAIAAYERTVLGNRAPFQRWLRGDHSALTHDEKEGAILFFSKANCYQCHNSPAFNSESFHALAMNDLYGPDVLTTDIHELSGASSGRGGFSGESHLVYAFKVPQLYNLKDSPFYGHGGNFTSVYDIIQYKNNAIPENENIPSHKIDSLFVPLGLTNEEIQLITVFLENALYDPDLYRYAPTSLPSGNCFPNADSLSLIELGCQ